MCGIVGYIGQPSQLEQHSSLDVLMEGLKRLEYRGYDSAGIAVVTDGAVEHRKKAGKLANLTAELEEHPVPVASVGIGHTRWATHGGPTDLNAHPHLADDDQLAVIHNGIIENFAELKKELLDNGITFRSETDTEVATALLGHIYRHDGNQDLTRSMQLASQRLEGAFTLLAVFERENPGVLVTRLRPGLIFGAVPAPEIKDYFIGDLVPAKLLTWLLAIRRLPVLPFPAGIRFQAVSAQDIAETYWQVVRQKAGGAFNVAAEPVLDAQTMGQLLGSRRYLELPVSVFKAAAAVTYAARLQPTDPGWVDMAETVPIMDTTKLREATGWRETISSQQALRALLDHFDGAEGLGNAGHRSSSPLE